MQLFKLSNMQAVGLVNSHYSIYDGETKKTSKQRKKQIKKTTFIHVRKQ